MIYFYVQGSMIVFGAQVVMVPTQGSNLAGCGLMWIMGWPGISGFLVQSQTLLKMCNDCVQMVNACNEQVTLL